MVYLSPEIYFFHLPLEHFQEDCGATFTQKYQEKFQFKWSTKDTSAKKKYAHARTS